MDIKVVVERSGKEGCVGVVFDPAVQASSVVQKGKLRELRIKVDKKKLNRRKLALFFRQVILEMKKHRIEQAQIEWGQIVSLISDMETRELADMFTTHAMMANYKFTTYKETPKEGWGFVKEIFLVTSSELKKEVGEGVRRGSVVAQEVNDCRDLANTPGGDMTPAILERYIKKAIRGTKVTLKTLNVADMKKLKMGGVLGVAQGSKELPKFLILEYKGSSKGRPIVLVGKGVTFDSGGLDIKPSPYAVDMHMDMSGGAAVIHTILGAARLGLKKRVVALIPAVENMPSGESYRPGDILRSMSGKTIEVLNTDAEGRIILADALTYAQKYKPEVVVDVATLTGASVVALGTRASAVFSNDDEFVDRIRVAGEESGDYVWPLPLWEEFEADVQGNFADVANMQTKGSPREGGTIIAATFLYQFAKSFKKWVHIDMAPRMVASHDEHLEKGAIGAPVRLLIRLLETK